MIFIGILVAWAVLNTITLPRYSAAFDPYPYVFLNLILSMVAALQAPIILMSQNRQAMRDRLEHFPLDVNRNDHGACVARANQIRVLRR